MSLTSISGLQLQNVAGSEQMTLKTIEQYVSGTLEYLDEHAPRGPSRLGLSHDRDTVISGSSSASDAAGCRPDSYCIVEQRLLFVGEDKVAALALLIARI